MTGLLILIVLTALVMLALEPANRRRNQLTPLPGEDLSRDRDRDRVIEDLRSRPSLPALVRRIAGPLASAGGAVPMHRAAIKPIQPQREHRAA